MSAITGRFDADFSAFQTAVDQALVKLRSFETGASKVQSSLDRMADKFSGRKIVSEAFLMAEAIEQLGGTAKLTEAELVQVGNTAAEAAEKMKALGMDVPDKIANLAQHAKAATDEFASMKSVVTSLIGGFSTAFVVDKVLAFGKSVMASATEMRNLSLQTQIAVEDLQFYGSVTQDVGISTEQLGQAINQMAQRVAGDDASAASSLHKLGLSVTDLKNQNPLQLFTTLMQAIDQTADPFERLQRASDLFGDRLGPALSKAAHGFAQAVNDARALNSVMSTETVNAAAKAEENWNRLATNAKNITANLLGGWFDAFNAQIESLDKGVSKWDTLKAHIKDAFDYATGFATGPGGNVVALLAGAGKPGGGGGRDIALAPETKPLSPEQTWAAILKDQVKALTTEQEKYISQLYDINLLTEKNAKSFGVSVEQMDAYKKKQEETIALQVAQSEQLKALEALRLEVTKKAGAEQDKLNEKKQKEIDLQSAFVVSLLSEVEAAKKVNEARAVAAAGGPIADRGLDAALARDKELDRIRSMQERAGGNVDVSPLVLKAWQNFDQAMGTLKEVVSKPAPVTTTINVNGVLDPRTMNELTDEVSARIFQRMNRKVGG
jgi:hypothetical protein